MSQIQQLDFKATDLQGLYDIDQRKSMAAYFVAASVDNFQSLERIVEAASDLMPNVFESLQKNPVKLKTVGSATALATTALEELTGRHANYYFADGDKGVLLGLEIPTLNGEKSLIFDSQRGAFELEENVAWEQRARQEFTAEPAVSQGASYAL